MVDPRRPGKAVQVDLVRDRCGNTLRNRLARKRMEPQRPRRPQRKTLCQAWHCAPAQEAKGWHASFWRLCRSAFLIQLNSYHPRVLGLRFRHSCGVRCLPVRRSCAPDGLWCWTGPPVCRLRQVSGTCLTADSPNSLNPAVSATYTVSGDPTQCRHSNANHHAG